MRLRQAIRVACVFSLVAVAAPLEARAEYYTPFNAFAAGDNAQHGNTVQCDAGDIAIGGGVAVPEATYADGVYLNTSRSDPVLNPMGGGWTIYVDNYLGGDPANNPRAYAVCDSKGKPANYFLRSEGMALGDGTQNGGVAACEPGEVAVGGGGRSLDGVYTDENYQLISTPWDDPTENGSDRDDGWQVEFANDEGGAAANTVSVYVVCDKKHKASGFEWVKEKSKVKDGDLETAAAKCGKRPLVGGGVYGSGRYEHGLYIGQSFPRSLAGSRKAWTASVHNYETPDDDTRKFTVWAICKK